MYRFQWTGHDDFAGNNVLSIALEMPDDMLEAGPQMGIWASISLRRDGRLSRWTGAGDHLLTEFPYLGRPNPQRPDT